MLRSHSFARIHERTFRKRMGEGRLDLGSLQGGGGQAHAEW
jgi:hypothetical protein